MVADVEFAPGWARSSRTKASFSLAVIDEDAARMMSIARPDGFMQVALIGIVGPSARAAPASGVTAAVRRAFHVFLMETDIPRQLV